MLDDPNERRDDTAGDPAKRLAEKLADLRMLAELAAIFEGPRKFQSRVSTDLSIEQARKVQRDIALLERGKKPGVPVLPAAKQPEAIALLERVEELQLAPGDYHLHRRPGEVMLVRWLDDMLADAFYQRMQAHFDTVLEQAREDERQALAWRQDPATQAYLEGLDKAKFNMEEYYARAFARVGACVLSTLTTDDMNILFLAEHLMGIAPAELVGAASVPEDPFDEGKLGWYCKLFSLRGPARSRERLLFFAFLQRSEGEFAFDGEG